MSDPFKHLATAREVFLSGVDDEDRAENEKVLNEWEQSILKNKAYADWKDQDITRELNAQVRKAYIDLGLELATNRSLTEAQRESLWARQDACLFILNLTDQDAKGAITAVVRDIRRAVGSL